MSPWTITFDATVSTRGYDHCWGVFAPSSRAIMVAWTVTSEIASMHALCRFRSGTGGHAVPPYVTGCVGASLSNGLDVVSHPCSALVYVTLMFTVACLMCVWGTCIVLTHWHRVEWWSVSGILLCPTSNKQLGQTMSLMLLLATTRYGGGQCSISDHTWHRFRQQCNCWQYVHAIYMRLTSMG